MIKKIKKFFSLLLTLLVIVCLLTGWWLFSNHNINSASVYVNSGDPFYKVVVSLKDRGVIESGWLFSKVGIIIGLDRHIIPGRYDFGKSASNFKVLYKLWRGDIAFMTVTIPEGYNLKQIGTILSQRCGFDQDIFDSLARDSAYLLSLGIKTGFAEGYLFPETYNFRWGIPAKEVFAGMVAELFERINDTLLNRADSLGYDLAQLLTMASIIELESGVADEFGKIASVYYNRRRIGMKLQADPTVIYAMGGLNRQLLQRDYRFPSRYNTYIHKGLPPTPICSPGIGAIMAALYPDSTDYFYFVADDNGRHVFNKTYKQHLVTTRQIKQKSK